MAQLNREALLAAYDDVRNDKTTTSWAVFVYEAKDKQINTGALGESFDELRKHLTDDHRAFVFLRVEVGDELSRRAKFVFLTFCGRNVSGMKKAKMATDKLNVKTIIENFAIELLLEDSNEVNESSIKAQVQKAGGANYGTGKRDSFVRPASALSELSDTGLSEISDKEEVDVKNDDSKEENPVMAPTPTQRQTSPVVAEEETAAEEERPQSITDVANSVEALSTETFANVKEERTSERTESTSPKPEEPITIDAEQDEYSAATSASPKPDTSTMEEKLEDEKSNECKLTEETIAEPTEQLSVLKLEDENKEELQTENGDAEDEVEPRPSSFPPPPTDEIVGEFANEDVERMKAAAADEPTFVSENSDGDDRTSGVIM